MCYLLLFYGKMDFGKYKKKATYQQLPKALH